MKPLFFALLAMLCWGIGPIFSKLGLIKVEPFTALTIRTVAVAGVMILAGLFSGKLSNVAQVNWRAASFIIAEGILAALLGQLAYYYAIKGGEVSLVSPLAAAFPLITVLLAFLFLGESLSVPKVIGALLIVTGVIVIQR
ncbi:MAG: EamA-like transporter family protein [Pelotomaculum sp. PtaB.Bin104]|nr:MAG: EamA-like transporter family protein [Pelotomaculum sp. PtaB.Bin104]